MADRHLLIVFHSQSGRAQSLALAILDAARSENSITSRLCRACDADASHFLEADALILVGPENMGAIAGGLKECLDRVFYPLERAAWHGRPYALVMAAGNNGTAFLRQMESILSGLKARSVQPPLLVKGEPDAQALASCEELGQAMAAGLALGVF